MVTTAEPLTLETQNQNDMDITTNIQAQVTVYRKTYTITFEDATGLRAWQDESNHTQAYGGTFDFVRLTTTRDAHIYGITSCHKA